MNTTLERRWPSAVARRRAVVAARLPAFDGGLVDGENASLGTHDADLAARVWPQVFSLLHEQLG